MLCCWIIIIDEAFYVEIIFLWLKYIFNMEVQMLKCTAVKKYSKAKIAWNIQTQHYISRVPD